MTKTTNLILAAAPATSLIVWTLTPSLFITPKNLFVATLLITMLISYAISTFQKKSITLPNLKSILPLILFIFTILLSLSANPEGRPEAIVTTALPLILLPSLAILIITLKNSLSLNIFMTATSLATTLLSIHSLLSLTFLAKTPYLPSYMQNIGFTPTGSYSTTLVLIIVGAVFLIQFLKKSLYKYAPLNYIALALHIIAAITIFSLMIPGGSLPFTLLPLKDSWSIALDALKSLRSLFFGIGLSNYDLLFSSVKPLSLNSTSLWNVTPSVGTNTLLTLLPTTGVLATASFLFLILRTLFISTLKGYLYLTLPIVIGIILTPATSPLFLMFFVTYALLPSQDPKSYTLSKMHTYLTSGLTLFTTLLIILTLARYTLSERYLKLAEYKLASSDSQGMYEYQVKALKLYPHISQYHLSFADLNFRLALALSQKSDLSTTERETIAQLIKQSIDSSKAAISLRPNDSRAWLTLGKIYQNLIGVAAGAEEFALEAYSRSVNLDRANPVLRIEYANLLAQIATIKQNPEDIKTFNNRAESEFLLAIQLKGDYSNAYYNLAHFYKNNGNNTSAKNSFEQALKYHSEGSPEHSQIQLDINNLTSSYSATNSSSTTTNSSLSTPSPLPSPIPALPIDITNEQE